MTATDFMEAALEQARLGLAAGEVPVGAVLVLDGQIVARAFNQMSQDLVRLETERAEILAGVSHDLRTPLARLRLGIEMSTPDDSLRDMLVEVAPSALREAGRSFPQVAEPARARSTRTFRTTQ